MLDKWLTRLSLISQVLLLFLAGYGYFYTVIPIYQLNLLTEEASKKEIELSEMRRKIAEFPSKIEKLKLESDILRSDIEHLTALKQDLTKEKENTITENKFIQEKLNKTKSNLAKAQTDIDRAYEEIFHNYISKSLLSQTIYEAQKSPNIILEKQDASEIESFFPNIYELLMNTLSENNQSQYNLEKSIPKNVLAIKNLSMQEKIKSKRSELEKPKIDIKNIIKNYNKEMNTNKKDQTPWDNFNEKQYEILQKYKQILSEYREHEIERAYEFISDKRQSR